MEIEDSELYKQNFDYGNLVGRLETMARINDKTDHRYSFDLKRYAKKETLKASVEPSFKNFCKDYSLIKIENAQDILIKNLVENWFFAYQNKNEYHLIDEGNNFSLYDFDWKTEFVQEFVKLLFDALKPIGVYKVEMMEQVGYYANMWEDIAFETTKNDNWNYLLHLQLCD